MSRDIGRAPRPRKATSVAEMEESAAAVEDDEEMEKEEADAIGDGGELLPNRAVLPNKELELKVGLNVFRTPSWSALVETVAEDFEGLDADTFEVVEAGTVLPFMDRTGSATCTAFVTPFPSQLRVKPIGSRNSHCSFQSRL